MRQANVTRVPMRKIHYCVAMSLDGYIAGPEGETDWVVMDPEIDFSALAGRFDTLLMGRRTFEAMSRAGHTSMPGMKVMVFSKTLQASRFPGASVTSDSAEETAVALCGEPGKDIWLFGGGALFRSLLEKGLVSMIEVSVIPVLLGQGIPLLPPPAKRRALELISHQAYKKTGVVSLLYAVK
jgi:dihydrofolate reductase